MKKILKNSLSAVLVGVITAAAIFVFKTMATALSDIGQWLYSNAGLLMLIPVLAAACALMWVIHDKIPESRGGGIPLSEATLRGKKEINAPKTLFGVTLGSAISFVCGVPVGTEGPSVLIGTALGKIFGKKEGKSAGAGAGFAVATGAPLSAVMFTLEELHEKFSLSIFFYTSLSVLSAHGLNLALSKLFNLSPMLFNFGEIECFSISNCFWLLLVAGFNFLSVFLFDFINNAFKSKLPRFAKIMFTFLITAVLGYTLHDAVFSGHHTVLAVIENQKTVYILALVFLIRALMMIIIGNSGVTGGAFVPTLALGALLGGILGKVFVMLGLSQELFPAVVLITTFAFLGSSIRSPITASLLFLELVGNLNLFLFALPVIVLSTVLSRLTRPLSFYDKAIKKIEKTAD